MLSSLQIPFDRSLVFDLLLVLVAGYLIVSSVRKGSVATFFSLLILCSTYPITCYLFPLLASFFPPPVTERLLGDAIAFAALMSAVYFLVLLLTWAILALLKRALPDVADQIAAGVLGLVKTVVIIVLINLITVTFLSPQSVFIKHSFLARSAFFMVNAITKPFPSVLKEKFLERKADLEYGRSKPTIKK